jgi:hypothetical protein
MMKSDKSNDRSHRESQKSKSNSGKSNKPTNAHPKCIFLLKKAKPNKRQVKDTFTDSTGKEIKELISTYSDGDRKELLIELEKQLIKLGNRYGLFSEGKWKILSQIGGHATDGCCNKIWEERFESIRNHATGNLQAQFDKFTKAIQKLKEDYFGPSAEVIQKDAMDNGLLRYNGVDHERAIERLFRINDDIKLLNEDATPIPIIDIWPEKWYQELSSLRPGSSTSTWAAPSCATRRTSLNSCAKSRKF